MNESGRSVFISYSWGAEKKHPLVDGMLAALKEKSIEVKRDSNAINYGDSIRAYMDDLAAGRAIILVLSEEYFKSPNCMYELREIYLNNRKEFRQRIFPVVLEKTPLHSPEDQILYIDYWEKKTKEFDSNLDLISRRNVSHDLLSKLKDYDDFTKMIGELQSLISDMYCPKEEELLKTGFAALIERMFSGNPSSGDGDAQQTNKKKESSINQNVVGSGNIFSGSGDVHVTHLHIAGTTPLSGVAAPKSKNHGFSRSNNLKRDINDLQQQRDLLSEKLNRLQKQYILETRVEEKFRLEHLIQDAQAECDAIDQKLDMLHNQQ
jgi:hypothetical protein